MALTQVKALGLAADSIDETKLADNSIDSEHYNDGSIDNAHLANNSVNSAQIVDGAVTAGEIAANAVGSSEIAPDAVGLTEMAGLARGKLIVGDSSGNPSALAAGSDNYVLTMDANGDCGWEAAAAGGISDIVSDTSPQLGGDLDTNSFEISLDNSHKVKFGANNDLEIQHTGSEGRIINTTGDLRICGDTIFLRGENNSEDYVKCWKDGTVKLFYNDSDKLETTAAGVQINGNLIIGSTGDGIDFSDTSDGTGSSSVSELFDDYEEGTWSPSCIQGTVTSARAKYTKIGNMVFLEGYFTSFSDYTTDSMFGWDNLPFTPAGTASGYGNIIFTECDGIDLAAGEMNCIVNDDPSIMVYGGTSGGSWKYVKHADLNSGAAIYMSCAYRVS